MGRVVYPNAHHVEVVAREMRQPDKDEVACFDHTPYEALMKGWLASTICRTVVDDYGDPIAMFGVSSPEEVPPGVGVPWLLGTPALEDISFQFLRESKYWVQYMGQKYGYLANYIDSRNEVHLRYIRWLGFEVLEDRGVPVGPDNIIFYPFKRTS